MLWVFLGLGITLAVRLAIAVPSGFLRIIPQQYRILRLLQFILFSSALPDDAELQNRTSLSLMNHAQLIPSHGSHGWTTLEVPAPYH